MKDTVQTTSLIEIRDFLRAHDSAPAPWASPERVVSRLHATLSEKRGDPRFWADLKGLAGRLEDPRFDRGAFEGTAVLEGRPLDELLDDLRASLGEGGPAGGNGSGLRRWASGPLNAAALLSFLVLGSAVACNYTDDGNGSSTCAEAEDAVIPEDDADVYCELVDIINEASIPNSIKQSLLDCLPGLDAQYREDLLEIFQTMTDGEIADYLLDTAQFCDSGDDDDSYDDDDNWGDDDH